MVDAFFASMYDSAAEPLPHDFGKDTSAVGNGAGDEFSGDEQKPSEVFVPVDCHDSLTWRMSSMTMSKGLLRRYLPPGQLQDLWYLFQTWCRAEHQQTCSPSQSVFARHWKTRWNNIMRFRKESTHSPCSTCFELKREMRAVKSNVDEKLRYAKLP